MVSDSVIFEILPHWFNGVKPWRLLWQEYKFYLAFLLCKPGLHLSARVISGIIKNQIYFPAFETEQEPCEESFKLIAVLLFSKLVEHFTCPVVISTKQVDAPDIWGIALNFPGLTYR